MKPTDIRLRAAELYLLPVKMRVPYKFGSYTMTELICARARVAVERRDGAVFEGWGETPLSVAWSWPSAEPYPWREAQMVELCRRIARDLPSFKAEGHAFEVGYRYERERLGTLAAALNAGSPDRAPLGHLPALVCLSPFDIALHDAYGHACDLPAFETYTADFLNADLAAYLEPEGGSGVSFAGRYPADYLVPRETTLPVWHSVGGADPLAPSDLKGTEPDDGYPVLLRDWIRRDGLDCLKLKLCGTDADWDVQRLIDIGSIGLEEGAAYLAPDFNCTAPNPDYVLGVLDRVEAQRPDVYAMILYVEQPFAYDLEADAFDVRAIGVRKPLYMDESAHDWTFVRAGRRLGWNGVALKTCKTMTGALLSLAWARAHGMGIMVQDLTNPMLAQIAHFQLAAHAGTIMGLECNAMQFYPEASNAEAKVHPGLYVRRNGRLDGSTLFGPGLGYRMSEIDRVLPAKEV